jgi:DNA invertase Pin-like site-specific DNA recombinase
VTSNDDTAPKRAVIYTRISQDRAGAGLGTGKQETDCRELAARLYPPVEVVGVHEDNDMTAFKGSKRSKPRPGYNALLEDIRSGRAEVVLAWHTDRLHRDMTELEGYIDICGEGSGGVPTYTVKGGDLHLETSNGRTMARVFAAIARGEVEHMIERQKSAKERIRAAGGRQGGPPGFGYRLDGPTIKNGGTGGLVQHAVEAAAIRKGYETLLQLDPAVGMRAIAREWNAAGLRTPQGASRGGGNLWEATTVRIVLLRARNAGLIEHKGEVVGKGNWDPIVSEDTWRAAKRILDDPARHSGPGPRPKYLLTGVLLCGVCGGKTFTVFRPMPRGRGRGRAVYGCTSLAPRPHDLPDGVKSVRHLTRLVEPLDEYVEGIIIERLRRPDVLAALNTRPEVDIAALDARRTEINTELDAWATADGITPRQLQLHNAPLLTELSGIERQISEALRGEPLPEFTGKDPAKVWAKLKADGNIERMRAVVKMLLRVRLLPVGKRGRVPFNYDAVEILPPDAS